MNEITNSYFDSKLDTISTGRNSENRALAFELMNASAK